MFWLKFIKDPDSKKIEHMYGMEVVYQEAQVAYHRAIADSGVQELLRIRDKAEKNYQDALARRQEKGEKLGTEKAGKKAEKEKQELVARTKVEKIELAKNLMKAGVSTDIIENSLRLSVKEIQNL